MKLQKTHARRTVTVDELYAVVDTVCAKARVQRGKNGTVASVQYVTRGRHGRHTLIAELHCRHAHSPLAFVYARV